ncbi:MAG TPA: sodium:alanine symporter family protein [Smithellaceae bacterium]|jgi:AGCS family alanine or glycine:cation symporter|nr:sodium:alanine symporter family protein [Smithellaceae bacterium]HNT91255.1 sodium:alanine symporter family protein [Smithellaceae bacterium]HNV63985.1 sodium:alanine symporter family protein [Smithellaceae bacterium]HNZ32330.1 sodium:alanine symporter family protein [Smithellaceae bacterium]HOD31232.1 sodium:alanine symporter family protein [Smithellaceae bacterium]
MQAFHDFIIWLNGYLWGPPILVLLFGTHLFLTFRLRFIQRYIGLGIKLSFKKDTSGEGDVSQFGALTTALAATIGTGNIVGVATAVTLGGPGAVLWMWLTGVFGISTKYSEALLAVKYRVKTSDGTMLGGPMYALEKGLKMKWLAVLFCIFTAIASFGIGNMTQANSISALAGKTLNLPPYITGVIMTILVGIVIIGGIKSIARVCEKLVPFMAIFYVIGCLIILALNANYIVPAIVLIVKSAFTPHAASGGFIGATVLMATRYGIARGLFSNESGLGSAPIAAAAAQTKNPIRQALVSATGTFWDTVVICLMTGLVLVTTIMKYPNISEGLNGAEVTNAAFSQIPVIGPIVLTVGLFTFVYSTILGWSYYGERGVEYLFGKKGIKPYRILFTLGVFVGATASLPLVWDFSDAANALMAIPNLVALLLLSGVIVKETKEYLWEHNLDKDGPLINDETRAK